MAFSQLHNAFSQYKQCVAKEEEKKTAYLINYVLDHNGLDSSSAQHHGAARSFIDYTNT